MMSRKGLRWFAYTTAALAAIVVSGVFVSLFEPQSSPLQSVLREIQRDGRLIVLTRNSPTTYYLDRDAETGFEYELTGALAKSLGVDVEYKVLPSAQEILDALNRGEGHIAAAGIARTPTRETRYRFGPDYRTIRPHIVCRRGGRAPESRAGLTAVSLEVEAGTHFEERLQELAGDVDGLTWSAREDLDTEQILERVGDKAVDCAVAPSDLVAIMRRYEPWLQVPFDLDREQPLAWVIPHDADRLAAYLERWFAETSQGELVARLEERFYGHTDSFDFVDIARFRRRIGSVLPRYTDEFQRAAKKYDVSWTLLAAQAYQESHWRPRAKSPTGVRGMMMLTLPTAALLGVSNRLDPEESIYGGAKHMRNLLRRVPETVQGVDRTWFALAAYNVGFGHVQDARDLARRMNKNPDSWHDLQTVLPLLAKKEYYRTTKYGYARGWEPVVYVQRIRNYWDILKREFPETAEAHAAAPRRTAID